METKLEGINGGELLGFMAGLGAFRAISKLHPAARMRWDDDYKPVLMLPDELPRKELVKQLHEWLKERKKVYGRLGAEGLHGKSKKELRDLFEDVLHDPAKAELLEFIESYSVDTCFDPDEANAKAVSSDLVMLFGTGRKDYLKTIHNLCEQTTVGQLDATLFRPWKNADNSRNVSLQLTAEDNQNYALLGEKPGGGKRAELVANRLAVEAMALFPSYPNRPKPVTEGFAYRGRIARFRWPLWKPFVHLCEAEVIMCLKDVLTDVVVRTPRLVEIHTIFEAVRTQVRYEFYYTPAIALL